MRVQMITFSLKLSALRENNNGMRAFSLTLIIKRKCFLEVILQNAEEFSVPEFLRTQLVMCFQMIAFYNMNAVSYVLSNDCIL